LRAPMSATNEPLPTFFMLLTHDGSRNSMMMKIMIHDYVQHDDSDNDTRFKQSEQLEFKQSHGNLCQTVIGL
jgi:hypothetical protein